MGKSINRFQEKAILDELEKQKENKDLNDMQQHIYDMCTVYGLSNFEIASLLFSSFRQIMFCEHNKAQLLDMNIDIEKAGVDMILEIQKILVKEYAETLDENGKPKT